MPWDVWRPRKANQSPFGPAVTILSTGHLHPNDDAWELIGNPDFVVLLWDGERRLIGIRPTSPEDPAALRTLTPYRRITARRFMEHHDITERSLRWAAHLEDGVLCFDIDGPSEPVSTNNRT